jgi:pimeloyl-ACP methyl ester carboxylesterase
MDDHPVELLEVRGGRIAYEQAGDGVPVVFIHGTGTYRAVYGNVVDALGDGYRCIRYDRRGFAATGGPPSSWATHVEDAAAVIEGLVDGPAVVVGNSAGGVIALDLVRRRPELVRALVLAEPAWRTALTPSVDATWGLTRTFVASLVQKPEVAMTVFYRWATGYVDGGNQYEAYPEEWQATARGHARSTRRELLQMLVPRPPSRVLRAVRTPTTVVIGGRGRPVFRRTARAVARRIPAAEVITLDRSAHIVNTDDPVGFAAAIGSAAGREAAA